MQNMTGGYMPPQMPQNTVGGYMPPQTPPEKEYMPEGMTPNAPQARPKKMTEDRLKRANDLLEKYKAGKSQLDARVIEDEKWFRQRHWEMIQGNGGDQKRRYQTRTAWLFNALNILHSDAMDSYPRLNVLPREQDDEEEARRLSSIIPVVLKQNRFKDVYSENTWKKGRGGTAIYGIFWDNEKLNGLGDITIRAVDVLNLFWEPGKNELQKSANVFHVEMIEREALKKRYPDLENKALNDVGFRTREYQGDDTQPKEDKVAVVDWYYKASDGQKTVLHYCKYVNTTVLYASEDDWDSPDGNEESSPAIRG